LKSLTLFGSSVPEKSTNVSTAKSPQLRTPSDWVDSLVIADKNDESLLSVWIFKTSTKSEHCKIYTAEVARMCFLSLLRKMSFDKLHWMNKVDFFSHLRWLIWIFSEAHHPSSERPTLHCLNLVGQAASKIHHRMNEPVKKAGLIDTGATTATKR